MNLQTEVVARGLYVLRYFLSIAIGVIIAIAFVPKGEMIIFLVVFGGIVYLLNKLTKGIDKGIVNLTINDEGFEIEWVKQFPFHNRVNETFKWIDIVDYTHIPDQHFDIFRIRTNQKKIKLSLANTTEEFYNFFADLETKVEALKLNDKTLNLKRGKTFYETKWAVGFAVFFALALVGFIGVMLFRPPKKMNYGSMFMFLGTAIFFIYTVWSYRRKK